MIVQIRTALGIIASSAGDLFAYFQLREETRREFEALQPNVQIRGSGITNLEMGCIVNLYLHNLADSTGYEVEVRLDGWDGRVNIEVVHPLTHPIHRGYNVYKAHLEIEQGAPILSTKLEAPNLQVRYQDRWNLPYMLSYPVVQVLRHHGLFNIQIQTERPKLIRPKVSFRKMRRFIRETPIS